jgi:hypothetical protein
MNLRLAIVALAMVGLGPPALAQSPEIPAEGTATQSGVIIVRGSGAAVDSGTGGTTTTQSGVVVLRGSGPSNLSAAIVPTVPGAAPGFNAPSPGFPVPGAARSANVNPNLGEVMPGGTLLPQTGLSGSSGNGALGANGPVSSGASSPGGATTPQFGQGALGAPVPLAAPRLAPAAR